MLPPQASSSGSRRGGLRNTGVAMGMSFCDGAGGGGSGNAAGTDRATGAGTGAGSTTGTGTGGTGAHWPLQRAQRTLRPGANGPGTLYSAAQDGQVISTLPFCGTAANLATGAAR